MEKLSTIQKRENLNVVYPYGEPGPGGAYHDYDIYPANMSDVDGEPILCIQFQRGPRKDLTVVPVYWIPICWKLFGTVCERSRLDHFPVEKMPAP